MTWYRKYRPRKVADLHLTKVRQMLQDLMAQGKLPQVLLFAGPKGTGKTSTARIIGAMLNDPINEASVKHIFFTKAATDKATAKPIPLQEPVSNDQLLEKIFEGSSFLVQEMDAASNRGIDDIRALKERIALPPQDGLVNVYILDEAHMLTTEAFNALLKLLEEPPSHAVFILATTELHKIPSTIVSRCTVISFTKATPEELSTALTQVITAEHLEAEAAAITLIAEAADGSFRDAIKTLEQVASSGQPLTVDAVSSQLMGSAHDVMEKLVSAVVAKDAATVMTLMEQLRHDQVDQQYFWRQLCQYLHHSLLQSYGVLAGTAAVTPAVAQFLLQELLQIQAFGSSPIAFLPLELKLLDLIGRSKSKQAKTEPPASSGAAIKVPSMASARSSETPSRQAESISTESLTQQSVTPTQAMVTNTLSSASPLPDTVEAPIADFVSPLAPNLNLVSDNLKELPFGDSAKLLEQWDAFVELMTHKNSSVAALLRSAKPLSSDAGKATIAVFYKFHKEQLQQPKFKKMIDECIEPMMGGRVLLEFVLAEPPAEQPASAEKTEATTLTTLAEELLV